MEQVVSTCLMALTCQGQKLTGRQLVLANSTRSTRITRSNL